MSTAGEAPAATFQVNRRACDRPSRLLPTVTFAADRHLCRRPPRALLTATLASCHQPPRLPLTAALAAIHLAIWHCMENGITAKQKKLVGAFKNELIAAGVSKRHATTISPLATSAKIHKVLADNGAECAGDVGGCLTDDDGNEFTTLAALKAFIRPAPKRSKESRAWADTARAALPEALREYLTEEALADMYLKAEKRAGKAEEKADQLAGARFMKFTHGHHLLSHRRAHP